MDLNELLNNNISKQVNEVEINKIDIYLKQRTGRKYITEIFGINFDNEERLKTLAKDLRKKFSCCCSIEKNDSNNIYLKLSSKDINSITNFLSNTFNISKDNIIIHGD
jgi:translation initiation factor 1 (eIF-1/SUI1)